MSLGSEVCGGEASNHRALQVCSEPSPEPEGWPGTVAIRGTEVRGAAEPGPSGESPPSQHSSPLVPRGTSRSWQTVICSQVVRMHQLQPQDCHCQTHQHNIGRRPSMHSLPCIVCQEPVQPAGGIRQSRSLLSLPSPGPLLPLSVCEASRTLGPPCCPHGEAT